MLHLTLTTDQKNCLRNKNELTWIFPNLDLACYTSVGLSSMVVTFSSPRDNQLVPVTTNIIDKNSLNPSGLIHIIPDEKDYAVSSRTFEKWSIDSVRPRSISFAFQNSSVNIEFCQITLAFTREENAS